MAALKGDDLMRAVDLTIDAVLRRTKDCTPDERAAQMRVAMRELLAPDRRCEPRQWDSADISYEEPR